MQRIGLTKCAISFIVSLNLAAPLPQALPQSGGGNPELRQKVAAVKQSVAENQMALHQYTWTETQQMIFKGDIKSTKQSQCQYGPDGTVQKSPIGPPQPPPSTPHGLRGKVAQNKKDEMQDYMERVALLIKRYTPPNGAAMQSSFESGKASIQPSGAGLVTITFHDYALPGDSVTLRFDGASKKISGYDVNTYLDTPSAVVTLAVVFDSLPSGTNYVSQSLLDATAKQVQIKTTNSGYMRI
jgi:hypothetical protein